MIKKERKDRDGIHEAWLTNIFEHVDIPDHITQYQYFCLVCQVGSGVAVCSNLFINHALCIPSLLSPILLTPSIYASFWISILQRTSP